MSGPKHSYYSINNERREQIARDRRNEQHRNLQLNINQLSEQMTNLKISKYDRNLIENWLEEAITNNDRYMFRSTENQIRGIQNYIKKAVNKYSQIEKYRQQNEVILAKQKKQSISDIEEIEILMDYFFKKNQYLIVKKWIDDVKEKQEKSSPQNVMSQIKGIKNFIEKNQLEAKMQSMIQNSSTIIEKLEVYKEILSGFIERNQYAYTQEWIKDIDTYISKNEIENAERSLKGIENFINKNNLSIKCQLVSQQKQLLDTINSVLEEKELLTEGIKERVKIYSNIINKANRTLEKIRKEDQTEIDEFLKKIEEMRNLVNQTNLEQMYVRDVIKSGFDDGKGDNSNSSISGFIENVPVSVSFNQNNKIIFNIDDRDHGNCMSVIDKIHSNLKHNSIELSDIIVERTGQRITLNQQNSQINRIRY